MRLDLLRWNNNKNSEQHLVIIDHQLIIVISMYIYCVKIRVNNEVVTAWESFFIDKHMDDLIKTGCFTHYEFCKLQSDDPMSSHYITKYYYRASKDLERYIAQFAERLRKDVVSRFEGKFQASRELYEVLSY